MSDKNEIVKEQLADLTLEKTWQEAKDHKRNEFTIKDEILYKIESKSKTEKKNLKIVVRLAHSTPLAAHMGRDTIMAKLKSTGLVWQLMSRTWLAPALSVKNATLTNKEKHL